MMKKFVHTMCFSLLCAVALAQAEKEQRRMYSYIRQDGHKASISIHAESDTLNILSYTIDGRQTDEWKLPYPVYRFECGDINSDGIPEIAVGVVKSTRYSHYEARRLFIFKLFGEQYIRPLWLGSRVSHELLDFRMEHLPTHTCIRTTERTMQGDTVDVRYKPSGFGLKFVEYVK